MSRTRTLTITGVMTAALAAMMYWVTLTDLTTNAAFSTPAAALAFVTSTSIGIERIIETFWTIVGGLGGTYWPLNKISKQVATMVDDLGDALKPFHETATEELAREAQEGRLAQDKLASAQAEITRLKAHFDDVQGLVPDNQRIQLLTAVAAQNVSYLKRKYKAQFSNLNLEEAAEIANVAINGLQDFLATFKDNPGRRLISLYLGAMLGVGVAGLFGLDLFQAAMEGSNPNANQSHLNVILTGLLMGLGSNPTHEVIRAVQEYKKGRKGDNLAKPDLPAEQSRTNENVGAARTESVPVP